MEYLHCGSCGYFTDHCLLGVPPALNPREGSCHNHSCNPPKCDICGGIALPGAPLQLYQEQEVWVRICDNCVVLLNTCQTCNKRACAFMELAHTSGIIPYVSQMVQRGPMTIQAQVRNPELVNQTCINCICFKDGKCLRDTNQGCKNYILNVSS